MISEAREHQELKVPESAQKQWQSKKKSECVSQNPAMFSSQRHVPERTPKADAEVTFFFLICLSTVVLST